MSKETNLIFYVIIQNDSKRCYQTLGARVHRFRKKLLHINDQSEMSPLEQFFADFDILLVFTPIKL